MAYIQADTSNPYGQRGLGAYQSVPFVLPTVSPRYSFTPDVATGLGAAPRWGGGFWIGLGILALIFGGPMLLGGRRKLF